MLAEECENYCYDGKLPSILIDLLTLLKGIERKKNVKMNVVYSCGRVGVLDCLFYEATAAEKDFQAASYVVLWICQYCLHDKTPCFSLRASEVFWKFGIFWY